MNKTINSINLKKSIGRNYHSWVGIIKGHKIRFEAKLGRYSKKPLCWTGYTIQEGIPDIYCEANTLKLCVERVINET